jgi:predicted nucleotidyltransferase
MTNREQKIFKSVVDILKKRLDPKRVILFGSRAKNSNNASSDFDFAVECNDPTAAEQRKIKEAIEGISGLYNVDVVYWNHLDEKFQQIVLKTGKVIYER